MKTRFDDHVRLARGLFSVSSLWLGPKDLLYVRGAGILMPFSQDYIRFDLERIRSLAVAKTRTGLVLNVVYGTVAAIAAIIAGLAWWQAIDASDDDFQVLWGMLAAPASLGFLVSLGLFAVNLALGPTCLFQVHTATRIERLRPVRRLRVAARVMEALGPALAAAQSHPGGAAAPDGIGVAPAGAAGEASTVAASSPEATGQVAMDL